MEFRYAITPGTAGVESVLFSLVTSGRSEFRTLRSTNASGIVSFDVDSSWINGRYELSLVRVTDGWNRRVDYAPDGTVSASNLVTPTASYYAEPLSHGFAFADLAVSVTGGAPQPIVPDLRSVTPVAVGTLAPGQVARFRVEGSAGFFPLVRVRLVFAVVGNSVVTLAATADTSALAGEIALPITASMANGRYRLTSVQLFEARGAIGYSYAPDGRIIAGVDGFSYDASGPSFSLPPSNEFTVSGASATATLPRLVAWSREGQGEVTPGRALRFNYEFATVDFPIERATTRLVGPLGATREFTLNPTGSAMNISVTGDWVSGAYFFNVLTLTDTLGRTVTYVPSGTRPAFVVGLTGLPVPADGFRFDVRGLDLPPYFVRPPVAEIRAGPNSNITLSALGAAPGAITYQWYRGEPGDTTNPIPASATASNEANVSVTVSSTFWVRISSAGATTDSSAVRVTVATAPVITEHPAPQVVAVGGTATFSVTATGGGPFTYNWTGGRPRSGQVRDQRTLQIQVQDLEDAGTLACQVANLGGTVTSRPATLTVIGSDLPLRITEEPADIVTMPDTAGATFNAVARGNPPLQLRWQKDGIDVATTPVTVIGDFSVVSRLTLRNVLTSADAGRYRAVVNNGFETAYTREAILRFTAAPVIRNQPTVAQAPIVGAAFVVSISATGPAPLSYQWRKDGAPISGATNSNYSRFNVTEPDSGSYDVIVSNAAGSVTSTASVVTVRRLPPPLLIVRRPADRTARAGDDVSFTAEAAGESVRYTWSSGSRTLQSGGEPTFILRNAGVSDGGTYRVEMSNAAGSAAIIDFVLTVTATRDAPTITRQPVSTTVLRGTIGHLNVAVDGRAPLQYQWRYKGVPIRPDTGFSNFEQANLFAPAFDSTRIGTYDVIVSNAFGTVTSAPAVLSLPPPSPAGRLMNLSVRARAGAESGPLIVGFVLGGGVAEDVPLLVRAAGPALLPFGVPGVLPNPTATLYAGPAPRFANDDWSGFAPIAAAAARVGAFPFPAGNTRDAAFARLVAPGAYTVHVNSADATGGTALAEIYDDTPAAEITPQRPRLLNLSVQSRVEPGAPVIAGFALGGAEPRRVLVRATGPALAAFGVAGTLADPQLALLRGAAVIAENNDWAGSAEVRAAAGAVGAFAFGADSSRDAALVANLTPGPYTLQVAGPAGAAGLVLVEVYELP